MACDWICSDCLAEVIGRIAPSPLQSMKAQGLSVWTPFIWNDRSEGWLKPLIDSLKGGFPNRSLETLLQISIQQKFGFRPEDFVDAVFIPAPPRTYQQQDHAFQLAKGFAELIGAPVVSPLFRLDGKAQKSRTRDERAEIQVGLHKNYIPNEFGRKRVIWVDDVLTTGSTALACYQALGRPPRFEVWVLSYRSLLAPF